MPWDRHDKMDESEFSYDLDDLLNFNHEVDLLNFASHVILGL